MIFGHCPDTWDIMNGGYLGKRIEALPILFELYEVNSSEMKKHIFDYFKIIENAFQKNVSNKQRIDKARQKSKEKNTEDSIKWQQDEELSK